MTNAPAGVTWTSRSPLVASVDAGGMVRAHGTGTATIVAALGADPARTDSVWVEVAGGTLQMALSGGGTDTIQAPAPQPLLARLTWSAGCGAAGVTVRFSSPSVAGVSNAREPAVWLGPPGQPAVDSITEAVTDTAGAAQPSARLGRRPGSFSVRAAATGTALVDSVGFTVRGGAAAQITATPRDTALYAGATVALQVSMQDRFGNAPSTPAAFATRRPQVATASSAGVVTAVAPGRVTVLVTSGNAVDSVALSVVPRGRLVAYTRRYASGETAALYTFGLDGSDYRALISGPIGFNTRGPRWVPGTERIVFHDVVFVNGFSVLRLFTVGPDGVVRPLLQPPPGSEGESGAQPTRDGQWIYFSLVPSYNRVEIWRVRPDGTGAQRLSTHTGFAQHDYSPSPSPDGSRIAFLTNRTATGSGRVMRVMDVVTAAENAIDVPANSPRWSPVGDEIAYLSEEDGSVRVVRPDGGGNVAVGSGYSAEYLEGGVDWSPDGKWLVTCVKGQFAGDRSLVLLNRATGEVLPLAYTARDRLCESDWYPGPA